MGDLGLRQQWYKKVANNFLVRFKVWRSWGVAPGIFKDTLYERVFEKMAPNFNVLESCFDAIFQIWFFSGIIREIPFINFTPLHRK